ncbi:protein meiotic P26-like [Branchiostoma floridae x Branchiostoma belcheri]
MAAATSGNMAMFGTQNKTFGGHGSGTGQFDRPLGVTVSEEGEIFVADTGNQRIQVFTLQGTFVRQFPTVVPGRRNNMFPRDVAVDGEGNLWVVGYTRSAEFAVQYNRQGSVLRKFDLQNREWARGVAVDTRRNHILISKTGGSIGNRRGVVDVFRPDGTLVQTVGQQQGMKFPWYITVDGEGRILASDYDNHCVYVYNEDGQFLFEFRECEGTSTSGLDLPHGICTDRAGNIFVADGFYNQVEMFDKRGKFLKHITTDMKPCAIAMAAQGQLVVTGATSSSNSVYIIPRP